MSLAQHRTIQALRAQILGPASLVSALEATFSADPGFCCAMVQESVRQRFGAGCDIRDVTGFVARAAALAKQDGPAGFPRREAEAVIRMSLGEPELLNALDLPGLDMGVVVVGVLAGLFAEWELSESELDVLLVRATELAALIAKMMPGVVRPLELMRTQTATVPPGWRADVGRSLALAEVYRLGEIWPDALAPYNKAVEEHPDQSRAVAGRAFTLQVLERFEAALADYDRALELDPDNPWIIAGRATTYGLTGRYERALADYDRAIALDPAAAWVLAGRAETYRLTGRYSEALADLSAAIVILKTVHTGWGGARSWRSSAVTRRRKRNTAQPRNSIPASTSPDVPAGFLRLADGRQDVVSQ